MTVPHFDAAAVAAATPWPKLIEALRKGFASPHEAPDRHIHEIEVPGAPAATALLMPAWIAGEIYGVKLANIFPGNGALGLPSVNSLYVVFDGRTGQLRATMDGSAITGRRTAATSALASSFLSHRESRRLLVLGAGRMAPLLVAAHAAVRPIAEVSIWARNLEQAERLAEQVGLENDLAVSAVADVDAVVSEADIIATATLSREPLIKGARLRPGTHLDLVGAFCPEMRETDGEAVARSEVFIDTLGGAKAEAGDLIQAAAEGRFDWSAVRADLATLCAGGHPGRTEENAITLFKSVGAAIEDLVAAKLVLG
jgi:ornithine cyclodeaminase/alanine dehydrogenase-like protein (mu-crystallin family)